MKQYHLFNLNPSHVVTLAENEPKARDRLAEALAYDGEMSETRARKLSKQAKLVKVSAQPIKLE